MLEFGKYTLKYKPPQGCTESKVKMETSSEATLPQMLEFFTDFLKASGYCIDDDKELVFDRKAPDFSGVSDEWDADPAYVDSFWGGNPVTPGSAGTDTISLRSPRAAHQFETGAKTWDDVITFG
jgi:hypothetical protein